MRGEQISIPHKSCCIVGSPPLARGTDALCIPAPRGTGITPACAGNRLVSFFCLHLRWDHPRLRGEQILPIRRGNVIQGSPPLARGTEYCTPVSVSTYRITPACAGNSRKPTAATYPVRDHPRLRGEQCFVLHLPARTEGSPPLARGTAHRKHVTADQGGITPACAGNRLFCRKPLKLR